MCFFTMFLVSHNVLFTDDEVFININIVIINIGELWLIVIAVCGFRVETMLLQ